MSASKITLTVAPLGSEWSVKEGHAYFGSFARKSEAEQAAEQRAIELRAEGFAVAITSTDERPGGRPRKKPRR